MTVNAVRYIGPPLQAAESPQGWEVADRGAWRTPETADERAVVSRCIRIAAAAPRGWPDAAGTAFIGARGVDGEQLDELEVLAIVERLASFVGSTLACPFADLVCEALGHAHGRPEPVDPSRPHGPQAVMRPEAKVADCPGCYFEGHVNGPIRRAFAEQLHAAGWRADVLGDPEETAKGAAMMLSEFGRR